ncbi:MAG TPA: LysM peptidoglycan-binding domain-containing protein, partial [Stellaceae bacterium]|nr:LysM peptidoglycan-binding domain-containing protein [Stellaceae bacterium]
RGVPSAEMANGAYTTVQPGNSLWRIARRSLGNGTRYVDIYGSNRDQISDPNVIYPGQVLAVPKPRG